MRNCVTAGRTCEVTSSLQAHESQWPQFGYNLPLYGKFTGIQDSTIENEAVTYHLLSKPLTTHTTRGTVQCSLMPKRQHTVTQLKAFQYVNELSKYRLFTALKISVFFILDRNSINNLLTLVVIVYTI
jgi:hypothetical protein